MERLKSTCSQGCSYPKTHAKMTGCATATNPRLRRWDILPPTRPGDGGCHRAQKGPSPTNLALPPHKCPLHRPELGFWTWGRRRRRGALQLLLQRLSVLFRKTDVLQARTQASGAQHCCLLTWEPPPALPAAHLHTPHAPDPQRASAACEPTVRGGSLGLLNTEQKGPPVQTARILKHWKGLAKEQGNG